MNDSRVWVGMENLLLECLYQSVIQRERIKAPSAMNHQDSAGVWMQAEMRSLGLASGGVLCVNLQVNCLYCGKVVLEFGLQHCSRGRLRQMFSSQPAGIFCFLFFICRPDWTGIVNFTSASFTCFDGNCFSLLHSDKITLSEGASKTSRLEYPRVCWLFTRMCWWWQLQT